MTARVLPFGKEGYFLDLDVESAPDRALLTHAAAGRLRARFPEADVVVGGGVVVVTNVSPSSEVEAAVFAAAFGDVAAISGRKHEIPVIYDGPDLEPAARILGLSIDDVIRLHQERELSVELIGFLPGFAYLGSLDKRLTLPRLPSPRPRVRAGSVGIAGTFSGIYPFDSSGGWHLLGRAASVRLFDPTRDPPILFQPGDVVRFVAVSAGDIAKPEERAKAPMTTNDLPSRKTLVVEATAPGATIQDAGRTGKLSIGLPPSGPLDPETHAAANLAVGNSFGTAAIEIPLAGFSVRARGGDLWLSLDGRAPLHLADGERFDHCPDERAVHYLAVHGGLDVPLALGARATLLVAKLGGFSGRALRRGDVLPVGEAAVSAPRGERAAPYERADDLVPVVVDEGPHVDRFPAGAFDQLLGATYAASELGDRVGLRLDGPKILRDRPDFALPSPMVRGALQVSTDGTPIVFGPDHPTTGGYPVLAVVRRSSWGALARRRASQNLRFVRGA